MTTTFTTTSTTTFTATQAKYLASKIAADLRQMQLFYRHPSDKNIDDYITEVVVLLLGGYLSSVTYGFKQGDQWVLALKYESSSGGVLSDNRSGRVRPGINISGAAWASFLSYSPRYFSISSADRDRVRTLLPFARTSGEEPRVSGVWLSDRSYSNGGVSLQRQMYAQS